ncbi:sphingomyelin phosphodiesterase 3 isoform X2 [Cavia porcellus]|uniref:sphingomyelin phosphodiesterase 3 isoform X2 n=1 Tax=Cavia porcellus TaxID=10141 RepID=UPI000661D040
MVLYTTPFPNSCLSALHAVSWALIFPCYWLADRLVASFIPTTYEKRQRADDPCCLQLLCTALFTPIYLALLVASLPFAFLGFLFWSPLQSARRPYIYSRLEDKGPGGGAALLGEWKGTGTGKSFCFATANLCLLPDSLARLNNVFNTQARAKEIGQRIRNGAARPQIKIYIDSPTNTSISAASFSSLVSPQGSDGARAVPGSIKRTTSVEYKGDGGHRPGDEAANGPASGDLADSGNLEDACIVRISGEDGGRLPEAEDPVTGNHTRNGASGGSKGQTPNHSQQDGDSGSLGSPSASRESLVKARAGPDSNSGADQGPNSKLLYKASVVKKAATRRRRHPDEAFDHEISAFFPANLDFLCLQEVFDKRAAAKLKEQLHGYFEYVLYDVGVYGCRGCCSFKCLNSGLFFASRYPIMDVAYHCYPNGRGVDALSSKGALFLKIPLALRCASNSTALAKAPSPWPNCDCGCLPFVACASFSPRLGTALFTPTAVGEAPRRCLSSAPATPHPCSASLGHTAQLAYLCETLSLVASCLAIWLSHQILPLRAELGVGGVQKTPAHLC